MIKRHSAEIYFDDETEQWEILLNISEQADGSDMETIYSRTCKDKNNIGEIVYNWIIRGID